VISVSGERSHGSVMWCCKCDCGNEPIVSSNDLIREHTRSCGCLRKETTPINCIKHGLSKSPEYGVWNNMVQRCCNSNDLGYINYGGRGIRVCTRWLHSFEKFYADMGPRPSDQHSIDRRDNDGNYEPGNCRWATQEEQANNKRDTIVVTYGDKKYSATLLAREHNINPSTFITRLNRNWSVEDAVERPIEN